MDTKIATEQEAKEIGGLSYPTIDKKCCTKARANYFNCDVSYTTTDDRQLVRKSELLPTGNGYTINITLAIGMDEYTFLGPIFSDHDVSNVQTLVSSKTTNVNVLKAYWPQKGMFPYDSPKTFNIASYAINAQSVKLDTWDIDSYPYPKQSDAYNGSYMYAYGIYIPATKFNSTINWSDVVQKKTELIIDTSGDMFFDMYL